MTGRPDQSAWRPARTLEQALAAGIAAHLRARVDQHELLVRPDLARHDDLLRRLDLSGAGAQAEGVWLRLIDRGERVGGHLASARTRSRPVHCSCRCRLPSGGAGSSSAS